MLVAYNWVDDMAIDVVAASMSVAHNWVGDMVTDLSLPPYLPLLIFLSRDLEV